MNIARKILSLRTNLSPCYINKNVIACLSSDSSERNFINIIEDEKKSIFLYYIEKKMYIFFTILNLIMPFPV